MNLKSWRWKQNWTDKHQQVTLGVEMMKERNYTSSLHSPLLLFCYAYVEWKNALDLSSRKKEKLLWWRVISFNSWCLSYIFEQISGGKVLTSSDRIEDELSNGCFKIRVAMIFIIEENIFKDSLELSTFNESALITLLINIMSLSISNQII